jgi:hypothetical protein
MSKRVRKRRGRKEGEIKGLLLTDMPRAVSTLYSGYRRTTEHHKDRTSARMKQMLSLL